MVSLLQFWQKQMLSKNFTLAMKCIALIRLYLFYKYTGDWLSFTTLAQTTVVFTAFELTPRLMLKQMIFVRIMLERKLVLLMSIAILWNTTAVLCVLRHMTRFGRRYHVLLLRLQQVNRFALIVMTIAAPIFSLLSRSIYTTVLTSVIVLS